MAKKDGKKSGDGGIGISYTFGLILGIAICTWVGVLVDKVLVGAAVGVVVGIWLGSSLERKMRERRTERERKRPDSQ